MSVAPGLLEILACPRCKGKLVPAPEGLGCPNCCVAYRVADDIPVMIFEEAVPWTPAAGSRPPNS
jgi:uncharacterized protein YbaR (Trm112 family)